MTLKKFQKPREELTVSEIMLGAALRKLNGLRKDLDNKLSGPAAEEWLAAFGMFLRRENPWARKADAEKEVLRFESSLPVEALKPFVARDHFKVDISPSAPVKISHLGANFQEHFLPIVEENAEPVMLVRHSVRDAYIPIPHVFWTLRERHEVKLAHLWEALRKQRDGEGDGIFYLDVDIDCVNNFLFIYDKDSVLWVICVCRAFHDGKEWIRNGWVIDALPFRKVRFFSGSNYAQVISSMK